MFIHSDVKDLFTLTYIQCSFLSVVLTTLADSKINYHEVEESLVLVANAISLSPSHFAPRKNLQGSDRILVSCAGYRPSFNSHISLSSENRYDGKGSGQRRSWFFGDDGSFSRTVERREWHLWSMMAATLTMINYMRTWETYNTWVISKLPAPPSLATYCGNDLHSPSLGFVAFFIPITRKLSYRERVLLCVLRISSRIKALRNELPVKNRAFILLGKLIDYPACCRTVARHYSWPRLIYEEPENRLMLE